MKQKKPKEKRGRPSLNMQNIPVKCEKCSFQTKHPRSLKDHMLVKHESKDWIEPKGKMSKEPQQLNCGKCSFSADCKQEIEEHIMKVHPCQCNQCEFKSGYIDELKVHIIEEHDGNYCEPCNFQTPTENELRVHNRRLHDGIPYPCEQCGYCAASQISLLAHIEANHDLDENDASFNSFFLNTNTE